MIGNRNLAKFNEFEPVVNVINEIQKELMKFTGAVDYPPVDVIEYEDKIIVKADLPGINKNDIKIRVEPDGVAISGEVKKDKKEEKENYFREERIYGKFNKFISFPEEVDAQKAEAKFENGVLEISIPKSKVRKFKEIKL